MSANSHKRASFRAALVCRPLLRDHFPDRYPELLPCVIPVGQDVVRFEAGVHAGVNTMVLVLGGH